MSKFQIIVLATFVVCIVAGVAAFALYRGKGTSNTLPPITIWGTFPSAEFDQYVTTINNGLSQQMAITYVQKDPEAFLGDFVSALATGQGPDAVLVPADILLPLENKLALIPYSALPQRTFEDTYISEADIYISPNGIEALPFTVDPLVMYWNRDMFNAAGVATYPSTWTQAAALNQSLTLKDQNGNVRQSAIAMGDFGNVDNARELLATLFFQSGNPITVQASDGTVMTSLKIGAAADPTPAIDFFTQFTDPTSPDYSWNSSLPDSKSAFLSATLATYFGFASELSDIKSKNPNLNFDVAPIPQAATGGDKATYAQMYGFSLVHNSPNLNAAFQVISTLTLPQYLSKLSQTLYLPSVRRDVIAKGSTDPYITIFDQQALISQTWLDADPAQSSQILGNMISAIESGQQTLPQALQTAGDQYNLALQQAME